jgi:hypothetical protein
LALAIVERCAAYVRGFLAPPPAGPSVEFERLQQCARMLAAQANAIIESAALAEINAELNALEWDPPLKSQPSASPEAREQPEPPGRCEGRYSVGHQRDEPFPVTYRCGRPAGHEGGHTP